MLLEQLARELLFTRVDQRLDGRGDLPMLEITTPWSSAEIYLHGAQVTHFKKHDEPPLPGAHRPPGDDTQLTLLRPEDFDSSSPNPSRWRRQTLRVWTGITFQRVPAQTRRV